MNTHKTGIVAFFTIGMLLMACGTQEQPFSSWFGGKADERGTVEDPFAASETMIDQTMNGEYVEVQIVEDLGQYITVQLDVPAGVTEGGQWRCVNCTELVPEIGSDNTFFFTIDDTQANKEQLSGQEVLLDFEFVGPGSSMLEPADRHFSVTVAIEQYDNRNDTYLDQACRLIASAEDGDPDALVLLAALIPDDALRAQIVGNPQVLGACKERDQRLERTGRALTPGCSGVKPPDRGPFDGKIALTFDDGPRIGATDKVAKILNEEGVQGTFFFNGKAAQSADAKKLLVDLIKADHLIANHTQGHVNSSKQSLPSFGPQQVKPTDDLLLASYNRAFDELGLVGDKRKIPRKFFRFPFGATTCDINDIVQNQPFSYQIVGWHIDTADWCFNSRKGGYGTCDKATFKWVPDQYRGEGGFVDYTVSQAKQHGGGILLMHDIHKFTRENLRALIRKLRAEGFEFVRLDNKNPFSEINNDVGIGGTGTEPPPVSEDEPAFTKDNCRNQMHKRNSNRPNDPQGIPWQDYRGHRCVDTYHANYDKSGCRGSLKAGYCPGTKNILCCTNSTAQ